MVSQVSFEQDIRLQTREICKKHSSKTIIKWFNNHIHKDNQILHQELLVSASQRGNSKVVKHLLRSDTITTDLTYDDFAAICYSIENGYDGILKAFLGHKSFKIVWSSQLYKSVISSPSQSYKSVIPSPSQSYKSIIISSPRLYSSINRAGKKAHIGVLKTLIDNGRIDLFDSTKCNLISAAVNEPNGINVATLFIKNKSDYPYEAYLEALNRACRKGDSEISIYLLNNFKFEYDHLVEVLNHACGNGDDTISIHLLDNFKFKIHHLNEARKITRDKEPLNLMAQYPYTRIISHLSILINNYYRMR